MKRYLKIAVFLLFSLSAFSQGCSDAGLCNLQNAKEVDNFLSKTHSISVGAGYGAGFENLNIVNSYLEYGYAFDENLSLQSKLTYQNTTGLFGSNMGLGDVIISANYRLSTVDAYDFKFLLAGKIPLNNSNKTNQQNIPLPMEYQTSLGTYDLIIGSSMVYDKTWDFTMALQVPIINKNENQFAPILFNNTDKYLQTTNFNRKSDALLKVGYMIPIAESRLTIHPTLLSIFHLGKDTFTNNLNQVIEINESAGYTINCVINSILVFKDDSQLTLSLATPSPERTTRRPDGLVRVFGLNLQYKIKF